MSKKGELIHDLQTFLWLFEQGGYTRETMSEVLSKLEGTLQEDGEDLGGDIQKHVEAMLRDCRAYALGGGSPKKVVGDLDRLQKDLE